MPGGGAFEAANDGEARAVVAADPAVVSGVFVADVHPWRLVDWERHVKKLEARGRARFSNAGLGSSQERVGGVR